MQPELEIDHLPPLGVDVENEHVRMSSVPCFSPRMNGTRTLAIRCYFSIIVAAILISVCGSAVRELQVGGSSAHPTLTC